MAIVDYQPVTNGNKPARGVINVQHKCGHWALVPNEVNAGGKARDRDCRTCWLQRKHAEANVTDREENLPALRGSDKQVIWAKQIRLRIWNEIKRLQAPQGVRDYVLAETRAKWWIDNRFRSTAEIISVPMAIHRQKVDELRARAAALEAQAKLEEKQKHEAAATSVPLNVRRKINLKD